MPRARVRPLAMLCVFSALCALVGAAPASAIAYTWIGGAGNWNSAMYWSPGGVPGPGDDVTIDGGGVVLDVDAEIQSLTLTGTGSLEGNVDRDLRVTGDVTLTTTGTFSSQPQKITLIMMATPANAILFSTLPTGIGGNLRIEAANPVALGSNVSVAGKVEVVSGTLDAGANYGLDVGGDFIVTGAFIPNLGTVTMNGVGIVSIVGPAPHVRDFAVTSGATVTLQNPLDVGNDCVVDGTLSTNGFPLTVAISLLGTGTLAAGGAEPISVGGDFTVGSFASANSQVILTGGGQLGGLTFYDLRLDSVAAITSAAGLTVVNSLVMSRGSWRPGPYEHRVAGNWDAASVNFTFITGTSTIHLTGTNPSIATKGGTEPFYNLILEGGGAVASDLAVSGDLIIGQNASGTLDLGGHDLTVARTLTHSYPSSGLVAGGSGGITVGESWDVGNFDASTSTVIFDNAGYTSSIYGENDFFNFRCVTPDKILRFEPGKTQRILNVLELAGASGQNIQLLSDATPSSWVIDNAGGVESVSFVTVQDSSVAGVNDIHADNSTYISNVDQTPPGWIFASPDVTPPTVDTVDPASGAVDAPVGTDVQVTFSESMLAATVNPSTLLLEIPGIGAVPGSVSYNGAGFTASFVPDTPLSYSTNYRATVTTGVQDAAGNPLAAAYVWSFTTEAAPPGLVVTAGPAPPPSVKVAPDASGVPVLQLHLSANPNAVELTALTLRSSGTGDEGRDIAKARLYVDGDSDGLVGPADTELSLGGFSEDDGSLRFDGLSYVIGGGSSVDLLVVYDFDAATLAGAPSPLPGPIGGLRTIATRMPPRLPLGPLGPLAPLAGIALASIFLLPRRFHLGRRGLRELVRAGLLAAALLASSCVLRPLVDSTYTLQAAGPADVQAAGYPAGPPAAVTLAGPIQGAEVTIDRIDGGL